MTTKATPSHVDGQDSALPQAGNPAPGLIAVAWPTGRAIYAYTAEELALGVDVYTRAMKACARSKAAGKAGRDAQ